MAENNSLGRIRRFTNIPVSALGSSSRRMLARYLEPEKQTVSSTGISQDKEGLADLMGYQYNDCLNYNTKGDFTMRLIEDWSTKQGSTVAVLWSYLEEMERHDILEDTLLITRIERDVVSYQHYLETENSLMTGQPIQDPEVASSEMTRTDDANDHHCDQFRNITVGEVKNGKAEYFDAFVCYATEDFSFVRQMMQMLESVHGLKLCISNRDLMPGTSQYTVMAKLIEERCKKMIIVLSPNYLRSAECDFQTKFAQSLSPGSRSKKLIPVLIKRPCDPPNILRPITPVDYTKCDLVEWFWERLARSLEESAYGVDDGYGIPIGPPAQAMVEGELPILPGENTALLSRSSSSSSHLPSISYPSMDTDEICREASRRVHVENPGSSREFNILTKEPIRLPSMDQACEDNSNINQFMPPPARRKKDKKKIGWPKMFKTA